MPHITPILRTYPQHRHEGDENTLLESQLSADPLSALREVLTFIQHYFTSPKE
jgi:hypothetical protein